MNAISKRLLSWLCVVAMVLSMAPALTLAGSAVEEQPAEEIAYGSANLAGLDPAILEQMEFGNAIDNSDEAIDAAVAAKTCPMCGATNVEWKTIEGVVPTIQASPAGTTENDGKSLHYYFDKTFSHTNNFAAMLSNDSTICIALKSTADITCEKYRVILNGNGNVLNVMGTGKLKADQEAKASSDGDLGLFQVSNATLNLYGGNFSHKQFAYNGQPNYQKAVIRLTGDKAVVNIFDGATIGPETVDQTVKAQNVFFAKAGVVNMFGGVIQNGVAPDWGYSGNVTISNGGTFNMYGGTIKDGTYWAETVDGTQQKAPSIGGNLMVGGVGTATRPADSYSCTKGFFNMYGGVVEGGSVGNGGNGGGNMYLNGETVLMGGIIRNGKALNSSGGNIQIGSPEVTIGGTVLIQNGQAKENGGNILTKDKATITITGGKFEGGSAKNGGNIYVSGATAMSITGGIFEGGYATNNGGNIFTSFADLAISGGVFKNGVADSYGGNLHAACDLTIAGGEFLDGIGRKGGGNINLSSAEKTLTITGGTYANGWVTGVWNEDIQDYKPTGAHWGGNIRIWDCNLVITGGLLYGGFRGPGKSAHNANNIGCLSSVDSTSKSSLNGSSLTIGGDAVLVGDINISAPTTYTKEVDGVATTYTSTGTAVTLKGAPTIVNKYQLADGTEIRATSGALAVAKNAEGNAVINIDELTADAKIMVTTVTDVVISTPSENAAVVVDCFSTTNPEQIVKVNADNALQVVDKPFEAPVKPEAEMGGQNVTDEVWNEVVTAAQIQDKAKNFKLDAEGKAECPVCGEVVVWQEATQPGQTDNWTKSRHYYLAASTEVKVTYNWLTVAGAKKNEDGSASDQIINAENVTVCLMLLNGNTPKEIGGMIGPRNSTANCTFNIMGNGIVTSNGKSTSDSQFGVVSVQGSGNTVNLYGGTFIYTGDGQGRVKVDNVYQPSGVVTAAALNIKGESNTVNMFNGVTIGPEKQDLSKVSYNVRMEVASAKKLNTFNMYGGTIRNGVTNDKATGGNLHMHYNSKYTQTKPTFNMYGGSIVGGSYVQGEGITAVDSKGGNIYAGAGSQVNIYGGTISDGQAKVGGGNIYAIESSVSKIKLVGGTVTRGYAKDGGNIFDYTSMDIGEYALIENGVATNNGGNVYIYATSNCVSSITGGEIKNGEAKYGGNIAVVGSENNAAGPIVTIDGTAKLEGGEANYGGSIYQAKCSTVTMVNGEVKGGHSATNGGNIYMTNNVTFTQKGGKVYEGTCAGTGGGNLFVNTGCTYNMEGGEIFDGANTSTGSNANAGNILIQGTRVELDKEAQIEEFNHAYFNMSGDAKVYGGQTANQGGNLRAYIGTVTMTDNAKIYGGNAGGANTDNVWLVDADLIMDGNAAVYGTESGAASAVQASVYRCGSNVTLKGAAFIGNEDGIANGAMSITNGNHANYGTPLYSKLIVDNGWIGTAYANIAGEIAIGAPVDENNAVCGTETDGVFTKGGTFAGKLYYGKFANCPVSAVDGILSLEAKNAVAKADGSSQWYDTAAEALENYKYGEDLYVILVEDATISSDVAIELAGQNITLSGKGKIYGTDSSNDSFESFGVITLAEGAEIEYASHTYNSESGCRYVAVLNGNALSFHYLTMSITDVTLRTEGAGIYYKSKFKCDETLAAAIDGYGMVLSLNDMPGTDFMTEDDINLTTMVNGPLVLDAKGECVTNSGAVVGIVKNERTAEENQQIAEMKIYSNAYVKVGDSYVLFKGENPYAEPDPEKDVIANSLKDVLVKINAGFDAYEAAEKKIIKEFYETWKDQGIGAWEAELGNIAAYEIPAE